MHLQFPRDHANNRPSPSAKIVKKMATVDDPAQRITASYHPKRLGVSLDEWKDSSFTLVGSSGERAVQQTHCRLPIGGIFRQLQQTWQPFIETAHANDQLPPQHPAKKIRASEGRVSNGETYEPCAVPEIHVVVATVIWQCSSNTVVFPPGQIRQRKGRRVRRLATSDTCVLPDTAEHMTRLGTEHNYRIMSATASVRMRGYPLK